MRKPTNEFLMKIKNKIKILEKNFIAINSLIEQLEDEVNPGSKMPEKEDLENLYNVENQSLTDISILYDVAPTTVLFWLKKYGIHTRKAGSNNKQERFKMPSNFNEEWLREEYKTKSSTDIAATIGVTSATVLRILRDFGIEIRKKSQRTNSVTRPTAQELTELRKNKTLEEIGKIYGVTKESVRQWLKKTS